MMTPGFESGPFCEERRDDIILFLFDEMGPGAQEAFQSHLVSCAGCRREVDSLRRTLDLVGEATHSAIGSIGTTNGDGLSWEAEWTLLRRRLLSGSDFDSGAIPFPSHARARGWLARAATVVLTAGLAFSGGYLWRGHGSESAGRREPASHAAPPISGASVGNYFDNLDDFSRDTHNFLRRSRMMLMEFSNLGADSDPSFFRESCPELLDEVRRYRVVMERMQQRKLVDLLDQIAGILTEISQVDQGNQARIIGEVKGTLRATGLIATIEILESNIERDLQGQSHV